MFQKHFFGKDLVKIGQFFWLFYYNKIITLSITTMTIFSGERKKMSFYTQKKLIINYHFFHGLISTLKRPLFWMISVDVRDVGGSRRHLLPVVVLFVTMKSRSITFALFTCPKLDLDSTQCLPRLNEIKSESSVCIAT